MAISRRGFLTLSGTASAAVALSACSAASRKIASDDLPESIHITGADAVIVRALNRAGYGPRPGDAAHAAGIGLAGWLEQQLQPNSIDDPAADLFVRNLNFYQRDVTDLLAQDYTDQTRELEMATIGRAIYSKRQLAEAMVEFWSDHFNIYLGKKEHMVSLKIVDDRDVIRPHALGKFRDLLFASAHSPAMMLYLDNLVNFKGAPNENYARELMELHTLSVHGLYTQTDIQELARALTGWRVYLNGRLDGQFMFDADQHDFGAKTILGRMFPAGRGEEEVLKVLEILVTHPATAKFIATKLARRFVADDPPAPLVEDVAQIYLATGGDIQAMLKTIFLSQEFASAPPRLKRPYAYMISALRALHADVGLRGYRQLTDHWLHQMGQALYHWPPPDGYPDTSRKWAAGLLPRWNFGLALATDQIEGVRVPFERLMEAGGVSDAAGAVEFFGGLLFSRPLSGPERALFGAYVGGGKLTDGGVQQRLKEAIGLMIASPAFQWT